VQWTLVAFLNESCSHIRKKTHSGIGFWEVRGGNDPGNRAWRRGVRRNGAFFEEPYDKGALEP